MWDTEIDTIVQQLAVAVDDATYLQARTDLSLASDRLETASRHMRLFEAEIPLGAHTLGYGGRGPLRAGLYLIRAADVSQTRVPIENWTPAETVEAHAAMPTLLAALTARLSGRIVPARPPSPPSP